MSRTSYLVRVLTHFSNRSAQVGRLLTRLSQTSRRPSKRSTAAPRRLRRLDQDEVTRLQRRTRRASLLRSSPGRLAFIGKRSSTTFRVYVLVHGHRSARTRSRRPLECTRAASPGVPLVKLLERDHQVIGKHLRTVSIKIWPAEGRRPTPPTF